MGLLRIYNNNGGTIDLENHKHPIIWIKTKENTPLNLTNVSEKLNINFDLRNQENCIPIINFPKLNSSVKLCINFSLDDFPKYSQSILDLLQSLLQNNNIDLECNINYEPFAQYKGNKDQNFNLILLHLNKNTDLFYKSLKEDKNVNLKSFTINNKSKSNMVRNIIFVLLTICLIAGIIFLIVKKFNKKK